MSHSWTGFGLLILATILHSTVLVSKFDRFNIKRFSDVRLDFMCTLAESAFVWTALVSGLRVIVSQARDQPPTCTTVESLASTLFIIAWAVLFFFKASHHAAGTLETTIASEQQNRTYLGVRVGLSLASVFVISILMSTSLPWTGRLGLICFFRVVSTHIALLLVSTLLIFRTIHYGLLKRNGRNRESGMQKLQEEDEKVPFFSSTAYHVMTAVLLCLASISLIVAFGVASREMEGNMGFWECWTLLSGIIAFRHEWQLIVQEAEGN